VSVRVAYVQRAGRGLVVSSVRLVGQGGEASWPQVGAASRDDSVDQNPAVYADIASWIRSSLQGARSRDSLELLCLDAGGTVYSWLTAPGHDPALVALLARQGSSTQADDSTTPTTTPVSFYAPTPLDSAVQPLPGDADHPITNPAKGADSAAARVAALAATDLPARMIVDALDRAGVRVGEVGTVWHAMAVAWDRGAAQAHVDGPAVASSSPVTAVVMIDDSARMLWCWSHKGKLLAGGSVRLRTVAGAEGESQALVSRDDVARVTADWVSWSVQLARSPQRVIVVLPERLAGADDAEALRPGEVGEELAKAWPGASVDAALHDDPLGATVRRVVTHLESTPASAHSDPGAALVATSARPGGAHRSLYAWAAAALALGGVVLGILGWRFRQGAEQSEESAEKWRASWRTPLAQAFPNLKPRPGSNELKELEVLIREREDAGKLPDKVERAKPVMHELEGVSLVLSSPTVELRSVKIATDSQPQIVAITDSTANAEAVLEALKRVGSTDLENWTASYRQVPQSDRVEGTYSARWVAKGAPR
jgi:hypothetical protein